MPHRAIGVSEVLELGTLSSRSLAMYNYYEGKTLSQTEDRTRKDSIIEVVVRVEPIGGGLIVMMLAGGASSGQMPKTKEERI